MSEGSVYCSLGEADVYLKRIDVGPFYEITNTFLEAKDVYIENPNSRRIMDGSFQEISFANGLSARKLVVSDVPLGGKRCFFRNFDEVSQALILIDQLCHHTDS